MRKTVFQLATASLLSLFIVSCADSATTTTETDSTETMNTTNGTNATTTPEMGTATEEGVMVGGAMMVPSKNIVENASASSDHTTLVTAVKAADLAGTLSGAGPFTVFAPTNSAFESLPAGTVDNLVKPENKEQLTNVLTYHVVPGKYMASDLKDGQKLKTVQGKELTVMMKDGKVMIDGATVTTPNVVSSNGVTHVIDGVVMPK
jgi:uncharacterized surface protein with fasciclin (FAS1) repeats